MRTFGDASLRLISALLLFGSSLAFLFVAERAAAALWQWYMFHGYETKGFITLSLQTSAFFAATMAPLLIGSLVTVQMSKRRSMGTSVRFAKFAALISASGFALYWLVALSPLNEWRP
jgi:hypothetical protein